MEYKSRLKNRWGSCYDTKETLGWLIRNGFGINQKRGVKFYSIPNNVGMDLFNNNSFGEIRTIAFVGDIMDTKGMRVKFDSSILKILKNYKVNYLVGNFEATIIPKSKLKKDIKAAFTAQKHTPLIIDSLKNLFNPGDTYLCVANNHAGDYSKKFFEKSCEMLENNGFNVFGSKLKPYIDINEEIRVITGSIWSNLDCEWGNICSGNEELINIVKENRDPDKYNIFYPHWGFEMEAFPRKEFVKITEELLNNQLIDAIIGHHSHCPQPITLYDLKLKRFLTYTSKENTWIKKTKQFKIKRDAIRAENGDIRSSDFLKNMHPVAFSLGDFTTSLSLNKYRHGTMVLLTLTKHNGQNQPNSELKTPSDRINRLQLISIRWFPIVISRIGGFNKRIQSNNNINDNKERQVFVEIDKMALR